MQGTTVAVEQNQEPSHEHRQQCHQTAEMYRHLLWLKELL